MNEELERLLEKRKAKVQAFERHVALDRRQRMASDTLQEHIIERARTVFQYIEGRLGEWVEALAPLGAGIKLSWSEEMTLSQTPAHLTVHVKEEALEERLTYLLQLTFTGSPDAEVTYAYARGAVINGNQGRFSLFAPDVGEQAWRVVSRFITGVIT